MGKGGLGKGGWNNWSYNHWRTQQQYLDGPHGMQQPTSPIGAFTNGVGQMIDDLKGLGDIYKTGTTLGGVVTQKTPPLKGR